MTKQKMIENILPKVKETSCYIVRTYGVSMGVGYDLNINVEMADFEIDFEAHATRQSWALLGHLRPNNPEYQYSGSCDYYKQDVCEYWEDKNKGLKEFLSRLTKDQLKYYYNKIVGV